MTTQTIYDRCTRIALDPVTLGALRPFHIDGFAGGGGASEGYEAATGRPVNVAVNHDRQAIAMHRMNHPATKHLREDIRRTLWRSISGGRLVTSAWFSPDCKDFSKAKGGKPKSKSIRGLAWTIVHMINELGPLAPLVLFMENVEEFAEWCPLLRNGKRNKKLLGWFFKCFVGALRRRGYAVEWRELRACERSRAPTIRKRLYLIARRDGQPITWPEHLFGEGLPNRQGQAADIIDFSLPCPSIFMTRRQARAYTKRTGIKIQRPLAKASHKRIADGVGRYVINSKEPFLVCLTHEGNDGVESIRDPAKTVTAANRGERCLISPVLAAQQHGGSTRSPSSPLHTISASPKDQNQLLAVHLARQFGTGIGSAIDKAAPTVMADGGGKTLLVQTWVVRNNTGATGSPINKAFPSVTSSSFIKRPGGNPPLALGTAFLAQNNGGMVGHDVREAVSTINGKGANQSLVALWLAKYYGVAQDPRLREALHSVTTKDRFGLLAAQLEIPVLTPELAEQARGVARWLRRHGVKVEGEFAMCGEFVIVDIGMRMLTARELYRAQGFGDDYIIDRGMDEDPETGRRFEIKLTKTAQVRMCGNSVCPPMAEALIRCNLPHFALQEAA